jgi:hypothetical protein
MSNWKSILLLAGSVALLAGCQGSEKSSSEASKPWWTKCPLQHVQNEPPDILNDTPLVVDGAMQLRDWSRSTAFYSNGDTIAGPTDFPYEIRRNNPAWVYAVEEPVLFTGQALVFPVMLIIAPPCQERRYTGATIEPTYTAMPALPQSSILTETTTTNQPAAQ